MFLLAKNIVELDQIIAILKEGGYITRRIPKKELLSIPNLMRHLRLIMIPVFVWLYLKASTDANCYRAATVMGIPSITDTFDGMVARKFNMITEFGRLLDPLVDRLTHGIILLCLWSRCPLILLLLVLFVLKEGLMLVMDAVRLREGKKLNDAKWFGKCCTALLFVMLFLLLLFPRMSLVTVNLLIPSYAAAMLITLLLYISVFRSM